MRKAMVITIGALLVQPFLLAGSGFQNLSFDAALHKAEKEGKFVFIDFYTTWCGPCKYMDRHTWTNPRVSSWLRTNAVALKVDADRNKGLARKYRVRAYPSLVFLKNDGAELDRIVGARDPGGFLADAKKIVARYRPEPKAGTSTDMKVAVVNPMARVFSADADDFGDQLAFARAHSFPGALALYDKMVKQLDEKPDSFSMRYADIYQDLYDKNSKQTRDYLHDRQRLMQDLTIQGDHPKGSVPHLVSLNRLLERDDMTLNLYDRLAIKPHHPALPEFEPFLFEVKLAAKAYQRLSSEKSPALRKDEYRNAYQASITAETTSDKARKKAKQRLMVHLAYVYEIQLGSADLAGAATTAEELNALDAGYTSYACLAFAAERSGQPIRANLDQASKAFELSKGRNLSVVTTYACLLGHFGQQEDARALINNYLAKSKSQKAKQKLKACLARLDNTVN